MSVTSSSRSSTGISEFARWLLNRPMSLTLLLCPGVESVRPFGPGSSLGVGGHLDVVFLFGVQVDDTVAESVSLVGIRALESVLLHPDLLVVELSARGVSDPVVVNKTMGRTGRQEGDLDGMRQRSLFLEIRGGRRSSRLGGE